jgi:hypothetical protein
LRWPPRCSWWCLRAPGACAVAPRCLCIAPGAASSAAASSPCSRRPPGHLGPLRSKPLPDLLGRHTRGYQLLRRHHAVGAATDPAVRERGPDRAARADRADRGGRRAGRAERRGRGHDGRLTPRRGRMRALCHFAVVLQQRDDTVEQVCGGSTRSCTPTAPYPTGRRAPRGRPIFHPSRVGT